MSWSDAKKIKFQVLSNIILFIKIEEKNHAEKNMVSEVTNKNLIL